MNPIRWPFFNVLSHLFISSLLFSDSPQWLPIVFCVKHKFQLLGPVRCCCSAAASGISHGAQQIGSLFPMYLPDEGTSVYMGGLPSFWKK